MNNKLLLVFMMLFLVPSAHATKFWAVMPDVWITPFTATVGTTTYMPVYIKTLGLLTDNYTITVTPLPIDVSQVAIGSYGQIIELKSGEVSDIPVPITPLFSDSNEITLTVVANSTIGSENMCNPPPCSVVKEITIKTGMASLKEFETFGLLLILVGAAVIVSKKKF